MRDEEKKALVVYYTRSGNTAKIAGEAEKAIAERGWQVERLKLENAKDHLRKGKPALIVLGLPVQYWVIPAAAADMIRNFPDLSDCAAFVYSCFGGCVTDNVPYRMAELLAEKGARIMGGAQFLTPHSCLVDGERLGDRDEAFGKGHPTEGEMRAFRFAVGGLLDKLERGDRSPLDLVRLKMNTMGMVASTMDVFSPLPLKRAFMPAVQAYPEKCSGCKACEAVCNSGSITFNQDGKVVLNRKTCLKCYGCMEVCPEGALTTNWKRAEILVRSMQMIAKKPATRTAV